MSLNIRTEIWEYRNEPLNVRILRILNFTGAWKLEALCSILKYE